MPLDESACGSKEILKSGSQFIIDVLVSSRFPVKTFRFMTVIFMSFLTKILSFVVDASSIIPPTDTVTG